MSIVRLDTTARVVWFTAQGREPGQDPYFRHLYRINLDGTHNVSLTPDDGDHTRAAFARRALRDRHLLQA